MTRSIKKRTISMCALIALMVSCMYLPASAVTVSDSNYVSTLTGSERQLYIQVVDQNGNPVMTPNSLPFDGSGSVTMAAGTTAYIYDTGGTYFSIPSGTAISFNVTLASAGKLKFGYATSNDTIYTPFTGSTLSTTFSGSFFTEAVANRFVIQNIYANPITITSIHID
ncbi:MAG: hypothetical protein PHE41_07210 [Eubacteriales bacterium]|jgi:hypothetical protein|nr:hypothetical protein [Eubacteriales bacterium]